MAGLHDLAECGTLLARVAIVENSLAVAKWHEAALAHEAEMERPAFLRRRGEAARAYAVQLALRGAAEADVAAQVRWIASNRGVPHLIVSGGVEGVPEYWRSR